MGNLVTVGLLTDLTSKAEKASSGVWRPVGRSVLAGDKPIAEASLIDRGTPDEARANAAHMAAASPSNVLTLIHEIHRLKLEVAGLEDRALAAEQVRDAADDELRRTRATLGAVTFPSRPEVKAVIDDLVQRIAEAAPECAGWARELGAVAVARSEPPAG